MISDERVVNSEVGFGWFRDDVIGRRNMMRYIRCFVGTVVAVLATFQIFGKDNAPTIRISVVSSQDLPAEFDSTRTYHYTLQCTNPESLITELWKSDVRVWQAWLPVDNICMGPIGPQFTVELEERNSAILHLNFSLGEGRLHCASQLKRFVISE